MKNIQKGSVWPILIVIVLVVAAGVYYYVNSRQNIKVTNTQLNVKVAVDAKPDKNKEITPKTQPTPLSISEPSTDSLYKIGQTIIIRWSGMTKPGEICNVSLEGQYGDDGKLDKNQEFLVPIGYPSCGLGQMSWVVNDSRIKPYAYLKVLITDPYNQQATNEPMVIILPADTK
jgi:hypothetical protein